MLKYHISELFIAIDTQGRKPVGHESHRSRGKVGQPRVLELELCFELKVVRE
jgi:hypothetical protein